MTFGFLTTKGIVYKGVKNFDEMFDMIVWTLKECEKNADCREFIDERVEAAFAMLEKFENFMSKRF